MCHYSSAISITNPHDLPPVNVPLSPHDATTPDCGIFRAIQCSFARRGVARTQPPTITSCTHTIRTPTQSMLCSIEETLIAPSHRSLMTSLSPGGGVLYTPPTCSSCHGHSNDPSLTSPSLPLVLQRLVDLLLLTTPSSADHQHLLTALHNATTLALNLVTLPFSSSTRSSSSSHPTSTVSLTPLPHSPSHLTIRILTPIVPLPSPLSPSSAVSLASAVSGTPCVQHNSVSSAALSPSSASQPRIAVKEKKSWASLLTPLTSSSSSSPTSFSPSVTPSRPVSPPCPVSDSVMVGTSCVQPNSDSYAAVSSSSPEVEMQDEDENQDKNEATQQSHQNISPSPTSSPSISPTFDSSLPSSTTSTVASSCRQPKTFVVFAAVESLLITQQGREETAEQESGQRVEAVATNADETITHTHPTSYPTLTSDTDPTPLPSSCTVVQTNEPVKPKLPHPLNLVSNGASRGGVVGKKRKGKHGGGGSKQKHSRKMMP